MASCEVTPTTASAFVETFSGSIAEAPALPAGFPDAVDSPMAWVGAHFQDRGQFVHMLTAEDVLEVEQALESFKGDYFFDLTYTCSVPYG
jgi:hypothetical protein